VASTPLPAEVAHQGARARRVAHHQRHDRVLAGDDLEAEATEPLLEAPRQRAQPLQQRAPFLAVQQLQRRSAAPPRPA
jgi:hypothetical protein